MITNEDLNKSLKAMGKDSFGGEARIVSLDDTIKFNCKRCGNCCAGRSDIILNPFDVYQIAKGLNITPDEVIKEYCLVYCGSNSCIPIVVLKEDERGMCSFLKFSPTEGKFGCSINSFKPGACMMHPIGIVRSFEKDNPDKQEKQFIEVPSCDIHGTDIEIKVKDFIKSYLDDEECHEAGSILPFEIKKYINVNKLMNGLIRKDEKTIKETFSDEEKAIVSIFPDSIRQLIYKIYMTTTLSEMNSFDLDLDFLEQIDKVKDNIKSNSLKLLATFKGIGFDFLSDELTEEDKKEYASIEKDFENKYNEFMSTHSELEVESEIKEQLNKLKGLEE